MNSQFKCGATTDATVQKDTWHLLQEGSKVKRDLMRSAYKGMGSVFDLELKLSKTWDDAQFEQYIEAVAKEERAIDQFDAYDELFPHLCDALDMVDWRAGEIRDSETANWLLTETLALMDDLTDKRVHSFIKTVRKHQHQLLTCLELQTCPTGRLDCPLFFPILPMLTPSSVLSPVTGVFSRCSSMPTCNGATSVMKPALELAFWTGAHPALVAFSSDLMHILDAAAHTNSINECVNGILKSFLNSRHSFRNLDTLQAYLDLFVLWHNLRTIQRGKRQGNSPFQIAGIHTDSDDWLTLLGF